MSVVQVDTDTGEVVSGDVITELDEAAARALTDRIVHSTTLAAQLVAEAWQGRAWKALGYKSWEAYADAELPVLGATASNRHVLLVGLREVGMSTRAISAVTGVSKSAIAEHVSGVRNGTPVTGTDGKQYDPSQPSKIRRTETIEFEGEATTREGVDGDGTCTGQPSPTFDPGEAALGDDAGPSSPLPTSPGSTIDVEPSEAAPSTPAEVDGTARPDTSAGSAAPAIARGLKQVTTFFTAWRPEHIRELNDPDIDRTVDLLIEVVAAWFEDFNASEPQGLTVIEGGRRD